MIYAIEFLAMLGVMLIIENHCRKSRKHQKALAESQEKARACARYQAQLQGWKK